MPDEEPLWKRGMIRYDEKDYAGAIAEWREASRLAPRKGYIRDGIGCALRDLGQREAAIIEWREAISVEPSFTGSYVSLANALSASGYSTEALAAVRSAVRLSPKTAGLYNLLGFHLASQAGQNNDIEEWEAAESAFQQALNLDPADAYALRSLATMQWNLKRKQESSYTLKAAIAVHPDDAKAYIQLWNYQARAGNFRGMVQTGRAIDELPDSEARDQHYAKINKSATQAGKALLKGIGLLGVMAGGWIWFRRRG